MKVAIYGQTYQDNALDYVQELIEELHNVAAEIYVEKEFHAYFKEKKNSKDYPIFTEKKGLDSSFDMFVSFGGDGTILRAITYLCNLDIPIVGVNTGRLGFLATFKKEDVRKVVKEFISGDYTIVERSLLSVGADEKIPEFSNLNFALNEVTVSRKDTTSMITVETYLNNEYLTSYWADGLIISTPTGSTGYSLSCGGPVIVPTAKSLVLTPIASLDSRIASVENGKELQVKKANFTVKMIAYNSESFLKTLRNKLLWGQDKRN